MASDGTGSGERERRLDEVLGAYIAAADVGCAPDRSALLALHPDLAGDLAAFFADQDRFGRLVEPLRPAIVATDEPPPALEVPTEGREATAASDATRPLHEGQDPASGDRVRYFGDYELLGEIGRGGMGVVYRARQISLDRPVALKLILAGELAGPDDLRRFRNEAEAAAGLDHPHIVPIYEVGSYRGHHYFSMRLIDGGSLAGQLARYVADPRAAARLVATAARAVYHAHQRGILHRDLKPSNILLDAEGQPHVVDFGLSRRVEGGGDLTRTGALLGSPPYMAPEQATGRRGAVTMATDVHGLGAVLYALLTGRPPFVAGSVPEMIDRVREQAPDPPRAINPRVDRDLEVICLKCLHKDPAGRYGSAEALADDLERWTRGEPIQARPVGRIERAWRWCRRNRAVAGLTAAVAGLLVAAVVGLAISRAIIARERDDARSQRRLAQANLQKAREAVDRMLTEVGDKTLRDVPQMEPVRRALLEQALEFYRGFLQQKSNDPSLRHETARAFKRVGDINRLLGRHAQALEADQRALTMLTELTAEYPAAIEYRRSLAQSQDRLAQTLTATGRAPEAERAYLRALDQSRRLAADSRAREDRLRIAAIHTHRAALRFQGHRLPEAEADMRHALEIEEEAAALAPDDADLRSGIAANLNNLASVLIERKKPAEAIKLLERAIAHQKAALRANPRDPDRREFLWNHLSNLAGSLTLLGKDAEARAALRQASELGEGLMRDFPGVPDYRRSVAADLNTSGIGWETNGEVVEAERAFRRALVIYERLAVDFPAVPLYREELILTHFHLGRLLMAIGPIPEAVRTIRRALDLYERQPFKVPQGPHFREDLASNLARLLVTGPDPSPGDRVEALRLAELAVAAVPGDAGYRRNLGVARYRAHDYRGAVAALEETMRLSPAGSAEIWLVLAMAHWQVGHKDQARSWFAKAIAALDARASPEENFLRYPVPRERVCRLRAEAAALLGLPDRPRPGREEVTTRKD